MKLSIIIHNYNYGSFLPKSVGTILDGPYADKCEVILVDDGSTDGSDVVINQLKEKYPELVYVKHEKNLGIAQALNSGFARATGDFFHPHGSDDAFTPDGLAHFFASIEQFPEASCFFADYFLGAEKIKPLPLDQTVSFSAREFYQLCRKQPFFIHGHTWFARISAFKEFLPYRQSLGPAMDIVLNHCCGLKHGAVYIPSCLKMIHHDPRSYSQSIPKQVLVNCWLSILQLCKEEPEKYAQLVRSGVLRNLGIRCIYKQLFFKPQNWKYSWPILSKIVTSCLDKILYFYNLQSSSRQFCD